MILLIIVLIGASMLSVALKRQSPARHQATLKHPTLKAPASAEDELRPANVLNRAGNWRYVLSQWRNRYARPKEPTLEQQLRLWIEQTLPTDDPVYTWLMVLSEKKFTEFSYLLADFCEDTGFELDWLLQQRLIEHPTLAHMLVQTVRGYADTCRMAMLAQSELDAFRALRALEQNPYSKTSQALAQQLFIQSANLGLTPPVPTTVIVACKHERQIYMIQAIRQVAEKQPDAFHQILLTVVAKRYNE